MSGETGGSILEETNPVDYVKPLAALTAAGLVGFILGINYSVGAAIGSLGALEPPPIWIQQAGVMQFAVMACLTVVVGGWIVLDYRDTGVEGDEE